MIDTDVFKTYDIRGLYPAQINEEAAREIGRSLGKFFGKTKRAKVLVARDGRIGSPELYRALIDGLKTNNLRLTTIGLSTTPMLYFLVQKQRAAGGIIVTASHNPKEWNGFKVVGRNAEMIGGKEVLKLITKNQ
jgi:phosphomannomutase